VDEGILIESAGRGGKNERNGPTEDRRAIDKSGRNSQMKEEE